MPAENIQLIRLLNTKKEKNLQRLKVEEDTIPNKKDLGDKKNPSSERRQRQQKRLFEDLNALYVIERVYIESKDAKHSFLEVPEKLRVNIKTNKRWIVII